MTDAEIKRFHDALDKRFSGAAPVDPGEIKVFDFPVAPADHGRLESLVVWGVGLACFAAGILVGRINF